jgi:hypothetical protein
MSKEEVKLLKEIKKLLEKQSNDGFPECFKKKEGISRPQFAWGQNPKQRCSGYLYGNKYENYEELCELCRWVRITPEDVLNNTGKWDFDIKIIL